MAAIVLLFGSWWFISWGCQ